MSKRKAAFLGASAAFVAILIGITVVINLIVGQLPTSAARFDLTENKEYTMSEATKKIFGRLKDIVTITYYVSKDLPSSAATLKQDTVDFLNERKLIAPKGKVRSRVVDPEQEAQRIAKQREEAKKRKKAEAEAAGKKYEEEEEPEFDPLTGRMRKRKRSEYEKVLEEFQQRGIRKIQGSEIRGNEVIASSAATSPKGTETVVLASTMAPQRSSVVDLNPGGFSSRTRYVSGDTARKQYGSVWLVVVPVRTASEAMPFR